MIPREPKNNGTTGTGSNGLRFLTVKEATRTPQPAKVVAARIQDDNFKSGSKVVACRVDFKGQHWILTLRMNNPNLDILCDAWGDNELEWSGKTMTISAIEDKDYVLNNKMWLHLEPTPATVAPYASFDDKTSVRGRK